MGKDLSQHRWDSTFYMYIIQVIQAIIMGSGRFHTTPSSPKTNPISKKNPIVMWV